MIYLAKKTRTIILIKKDFIIKVKARAKIYLPPILMPQISRKIKIKKTLLILIAIIISKKITILTNIPKKAKKLVLILATFILIIKNSKKAILISAKGLKQVIYI